MQEDLDSLYSLFNKTLHHGTVEFPTLISQEVLIYFPPTAASTVVLAVMQNPHQSTDDVSFL